MANYRVVGTSLSPAANGKIKAVSKSFTQI